MGFTGNFETLPIAEVFSLLYTSKKSGVLNCTTEDEFLRFHIFNGKLIKIESSTDRLLLGEILVRKNLVKRQDLSYGLQLQKDVGKPIGEILVELNMIGPNHVHNALEFQLEENMFKIVEWGVGKFIFEEVSSRDMPHPARLPFTGIDFEQFIEQFRDKASEFKNLAEQLPSDMSKISLFVAMSELPKDMLDNSEIMEVVQLADGNRTIREVRQQCSFGTLKAQRLIFSLYLKDILKVVSSSGTIKQKKMYETLDAEVRGVETLFRNIFIPLYQEIDQLFESKMGKKSQKITKSVLKEVNKKYPELFKNMEIEAYSDMDLSHVFSNINVHQNASWFHTVFSMLCDITKLSLRKVSGILGKTQAQTVVEGFKERLELHLEEEKVLNKKYNLSKDFDRLLSNI